MTRGTAAAATGALLSLSACFPATPRGDEARRQYSEASGKGLSDWANVSTNAMVEKYGPPDRLETFSLVWVNRGPWQKIVVWDEMGFFERDGTSVNIEETIAYPMSEEKREAIRSFSLGLRIRADGQQLTARSMDESHNFLMLNLADDIVQGTLTAAGARVVYFQTLELAAAGKSSPSMQRLLFR